MFPPRAVGDIYAAVRAFLVDVEARYFLASCSARMWRDVEAYRRRVEQHHEPAVRVALDIIAAEMQSRLVTGQHHIYRGVLSHDGQAAAYVWKRVAKEMRRRKYWTPDDYAEALSNMRAAVASVG